MRLLLCSFVCAILATAPAVGYPQAAPQPLDYRGVIVAPPQPTPYATIKAQNVQLALNASTQVFAESLSASVSPLPSFEYATLDDLRSLSINIHDATLRIAPNTMVAMVSEELRRAKAPLKVESVAVTPEALVLTGQILRHGKWLPFNMQGKPDRAGLSSIRLKPTAMAIRGTSLMPALLAADVHFSEIMTLQSKAFAFDGRDMILNLQALLPAPAMRFSLSGISLTQGAVIATLSGATGERESGEVKSTLTMTGLDCHSQPCPNSYLVTAGGRLGAFGVTLNQVPTLVTRQGGQMLSLSLHDMQAILAQSLLRLRHDGAVWMETPKDLKPTQGPTTLEGQAVFESLVSQYQPDDPDALLIAARDTQLVTPQGVAIEVDHLLASTRGSELQRLPFLPQRALSGEVRVSFQSLKNLLNRVTFFYDGAPLRKFTVTHATESTLSLALQSKPKLGPFPLIWSDTTITGKVSIGDTGDTLNIAPTELSIFGIPALSILKTLGLTLEDFIDISNRPDVSLKGNMLTLKLAHALPPLSVDSVINRITIQPEKQQLTLQVGYVNDELSAKSLKDKLLQLPPGMWVKANQLNAYGVSLTKTLSRVHTGNNKPLHIELSQYPQVLSTGYLSMPQLGLVEVVIPPSLAQ